MVQIVRMENSSLADQFLTCATTQKGLFLQIQVFYCLLCNSWYSLHTFIFF